MRVDRNNQMAWFVLADSSLIVIPFAPLPWGQSPPGCLSNVHSTRMEVLEIETEALAIGSTDVP